MTVPLILASSSEIRATLLRNAGLDFSISPPRIDEDALKASLEEQQATPRDIADALADQKARKVSNKHPDAFVLGCDQTLDLNGMMLSKARDRDEAIEHLKMMRGNRHILYSACVIYENTKPVWRHVGKVTLRMREFSDDYLKGYVDRNWSQIQYSVGCYNLEQEGVRLFSSINGDYFTVLGMPLLETLNYMTLRGMLET